MATFSSTFGLTRMSVDDWFDPDLQVDTRLFLDPFLLLLEEGASGSLWATAHAAVITHFARCYELLAKGASPATLSAQTAQGLLSFPEPAEVCLGYTSGGTSGSGSGSTNARLIVGSIVTAIAAGLTKPEHIEEIGILNEGIGADRISDAVCNVLKPLIIEYTKAVATRHGVATKPLRVRNARCSLATGRWLAETHDLPENPSTGGPILLVPSRFLNKLPTLNADDWFDSSFNADLRRDLNVTVGQRIAKRDIVRMARKHPDRIRQWAADLRMNGSVRGYDFNADPLGIVGWQQAGDAFASAHPVELAGPIATQAALTDFVGKVLGLFRVYIEQQGGWRLLWNDDGSEKPEEAAQLALLGMARNYCRAHGVELDREINLGRGPVDFKFTAAGSSRLLVEAKKLHNGDFWNGLEHQLTSYLQSDQTTTGWLLAVRYRSTGVSVTRGTELGRRVASLNTKLGMDVRFLIVDATRKPSASKIRGV